MSIWKKGLVRYNIADEVGDWYGFIIIDQYWKRIDSSNKHEFIVISDAKLFTKEKYEI